MAAPPPGSSFSLTQNPTAGDATTGSSISFGNYIGASASAGGFTVTPLMLAAAGVALFFLLRR